MLKVKTKFFLENHHKIDPPNSIYNRFFTHKSGTKSQHNHKNITSPHGRLLYIDLTKIHDKINR